MTPVEGKSATGPDVKVFSWILPAVSTVSKLFQFHPLACSRRKEVRITLVIGLTVSTAATEVTDGDPGDNIVGFAAEWTLPFHHDGISAEFGRF